MRGWSMRGTHSNGFPVRPWMAEPFGPPGMILAKKRAAQPGVRRRGVGMWIFRSPRERSFGEGESWL